ISPKPHVGEGQGESAREPGPDRDQEPVVQAPSKAVAERRSEGADQHHPFDADVQDPALLDDQLTQRRPQDRRHQPDADGEDRHRGVHCSTASAYRSRITCRLRRSKRKVATMTSPTDLDRPVSTWRVPLPTRSTAKKNAEG